MSERYIVYEIMRFVTHYLQKFQHVFRSIWDVEKEGMTREILKVKDKIILALNLQDLVHNCVHKYGNHVTMDMMNFLSTPIILMLH
jgi:hypothetical protein